MVHRNNITPHYLKALLAGLLSGLASYPFAGHLDARMIVPLPIFLAFAGLTFAKFFMWQPKAYLGWAACSLFVFIVPILFYFSATISFGLAGWLMIASLGMVIGREISGIFRPWVIVFLVLGGTIDLAAFVVFKTNTGNPLWEQLVGFGIRTLLWQVLMMVAMASVIRRWQDERTAKIQGG